MPRFSRKSRRRTGDDEYIITHLNEGMCLGCMIGLVDHSDEAVRPEWEKLRDTILPAFIKDHPGQRPSAWWAFESPGRRERIDGKAHPFDCKERSLHVARIDNPNLWRAAYRLHFGLPGLHFFPFDSDVHNDFMRNRLHGRESEIFEPEWSYLVRHGLLTAEDSP